MHSQFEKRLLDTVTGVSPWLTPLIPTYFAAYNAYEYLVKGRNWWDGLAVVAIALVVETVGLSGVHTAIQFWNWNRTKLRSDDSAPMGLAIVAVVMYVAIIILVNALLDFYAEANPAGLPYVKIWVVGLLSLLSLNSALIVALRYSQHDREEKAVQAKEERRKTRAGKLPENSGNLPENSGGQKWDWRNVAPGLDAQALDTISRADTAWVMRKFPGMSDRVARKWREYATDELAHRENGAG